MQFVSVEKAYETLAEYLIAFVGARPWDAAVCRMKIVEKMAAGSQWLDHSGVKDDQGGFEKDPSAIWAGLDAALFLRDEVLRATGHRIWGLTFTLYPTGKFNIEYDYTKPESYEESEATITLNDAVADLEKIGVKVERGNH